MDRYDDVGDVNIQLRRREQSPRFVRYVELPPRPHTYDEPRYLVPEQRTTVVERRPSARSRSRSPDHLRYKATNPAPPPRPLIVNNRFYNEYSSDDDYDRHDRTRIVRRQRSIEVAQDQFRARNKRRTNEEPAFQTCFNADCPQDITAHVDLPISDDIGEELESFSRLVRIGDFKAAKSYFEDNLADYQDQPYVFIQYAEMLLEMSDYESLEALNPHSVFGQSSRRSRDETREHSSRTAFKKRESHHQRRRRSLRKLDAIELDQINVLRLNWDLLETTYLISREGTIHQAIDVAKEALQTVDLEAGAGSTEIRIFTLASQIMGEARAWNVGPRLAQRELPDIPEVYNTLLSQGRIWDFRDFFLALLPWFDFSIASVMEEIFDTPGYSRRLLDDWINDMNDVDEATTLALLDLIVSVLYRNLRTSSKLEMLEQWTSDAHYLAHNLRSNHAGCMKSRTFARWILVEAANLVSNEFGGFESAIRKTHSSAPGFTFAWGIGVPVYVPAATENPCWQMPGVPSGRNEPIIMAARLAKELQDHQTEELCLELLIIVSEDPAVHFEQLSHLQNSVQRNRLGFLWTCLSRYLISRDTATKRQLLEDLNSFPDWVDRGALFDPPACFARDFIRGALSSQLNHHGHREYPKESFTKSIQIYGKFLPAEMSQFVSSLTGLAWKNAWNVGDFAHERQNNGNSREQQIDQTRRSEPVGRAISERRTQSRERTGLILQGKASLHDSSKGDGQGREFARNKTGDMANTRTTERRDAAGTRSDAAAPARKASSKLGHSKESPCLDVVPYTGGYHPIWYHLRSQAEAPRHFPHGSSADQFAASSTGGGLPGAQGRLNVSNTQENDLAGVAEKREKPTRKMTVTDVPDEGEG